MKLKSLLKESKAWERKFGEPLPTLEDTTRAYRLKQEEELNDSFKPKFRDTEKLAKILGRKIDDVVKFLKKYEIHADDLLDVLDAGSSSQRRRYSMAILAAMKGNRRALKQLDNLLGFL